MLFVESLLSENACYGKKEENKGQSHIILKRCLMRFDLYE